MGLADVYRQVREVAVQQAGGPNDLIQRATNYIDLYRHSGGNHGFPLLAAHGALWGSGHFRRGRRVGLALAYLSGFDEAERRRQLDKIEGFSLALKEINRRVFVETYTAYHLTDRFDDHPDLAGVIPECLIASLNRCHTARRAGARLSAQERRMLFSDFFIWEQRTIVGPAVEAAVAELDWPLLRTLSLRPPIGFAYFPAARWLWFKEFDNAEERLLRGNQAFEIAEMQGWEKVEKSVFRYGLLEDQNQPKRRCFGCIRAPG